MASADSVWDSKMVCLITGASQHIGAKMAETFVQKMADGSKLILTSRSLDRLNQVKTSLSKFKRNVDVALLQWDLRDPKREKYEQDLRQVLGADLSSYKSSLIVHNAAQLGSMGKKVIEMRDPKELQEQININLVAMLVLNSVWLDLVAKIPKKFVVNMTAPSATNARPCFGMTSMVKSGRQISLTILSKESPDVKVLHFDPGAADTDSLRAIRDESHDPKIREWIKGFYDRGEVLETDKIVGALVKTLQENKFETAGYVSAYDVK
jgi:sepiapterin reductase